MVRGVGSWWVPARQLQCSQVLYEIWRCVLDQDQKSKWVACWSFLHLSLSLPRPWEPVHAYHVSRPYSVSVQFIKLHLSLHIGAFATTSILSAFAGLQISYVSSMFLRSSKLIESTWYRSAHLLVKQLCSMLKGDIKLTEEQAISIYLFYCYFVCAILGDR